MAFDFVDVLSILTATWLRGGGATAGVVTAGPGE